MSELYHHGIKGMHWGVRRYQNTDGSLTAAGRARYDVGSTKKGYKGVGIVDTDQIKRDNQRLRPKTTKERLDEEHQRARAVVNGTKEVVNAVNDHMSKREKKKAEIVRKASEYSKSAAKDEERRAKDNIQSVYDFEKRYSGEKGIEKYLYDMYGKDWRNKQYMKDYFGITDVKRHGKEEFENELKYRKKMSELAAPHYEQSVKNWLAKSDMYANTPVSEISKADLKAAKKYAKKLDKYGG